VLFRVARGRIRRRLAVALGGRCIAGAGLRRLRRCVRLRRGASAAGLAGQHRGQRRPGEPPEGAAWPAAVQQRHLKLLGAELTPLVRTTLVDSELADAIKDLLALDSGGRLFRYEREGELVPLTGAVLNEYVQEHLGEGFSAKDFRTWGGTLTAAIAFAEQGPAETEAEAKRVVANVMRTVGERLGNTAAVARSSYVSPAVVDQYLDGRTIEDFRPRHLRIVSARDIGLDPEEQAVVSLLRSWRMRRAREAA
jgi:DNA topoisomerase IB